MRTPFAIAAISIAIVAFATPGAGGAEPAARVVLDTALGSIEIEIDAARAPGTAANFLWYVDHGFYDGGRFHRTVKLDNQPDKNVKIEVVQAGIDPARVKDGRPPIPLERTRDTGLAHRDGVVSITGTIKHDAKGGDGVLARLVSGRTGAVASWTVARMEVESKLSGVEVKAGETLDFVVQCRADNNSDSFAWSPTVQMADETWSALSQFGPVEKVPTPLSAWEKYAHVLLQSNEFMFVD